MKKILCLPLIFSTVLFFSCNSVGDKTNSQEVSPTQNEEQNTQSDTITIQQMQQLPQDTRNEEGNITHQQATSDDDIREKLKMQAEENWPNDYATQEYWINNQNYFIVFNLSNSLVVSSLNSSS